MHHCSWGTRCLGIQMSLAANQINTGIFIALGKALKKIPMPVSGYTKKSALLAVRTHYLCPFSWPHQWIQNLAKGSDLTLSKGHILTTSPPPFGLPWILTGSKHFNPCPVTLSQNITHFSKSCFQCFCQNGVDCNASQRQWIAEGHFKLEWGLISRRDLEGEELGSI